MGILLDPNAVAHDIARGIRITTYYGKGVMNFRDRADENP
jgi:hypothetical protein